MAAQIHEHMDKKENLATQPFLKELQITQKEDPKERHLKQKLLNELEKCLSQQEYTALKQALQAPILAETQTHDTFAKVAPVTPTMTHVASQAPIVPDTPSALEKRNSLLFSGGHGSRSGQLKPLHAPTPFQQVAAPKEELQKPKLK